MRKIFLSIYFICGCFYTNAQDPHFTQFYSAPFSVNPAYTGVFNGKMRVILNQRMQYVNTETPYKTSIISVDDKLGHNKTDGQNPFNLGLSLMHDNTFNGMLKSNYITVSGSYHLPLDEDGFKTLGIGLCASYGDRKVKLNEFSFGNQFSNGAFDLSLPSGETALNNMKPFFTGGVGLLYQNNNEEEGNFFDLGVSFFNLNKPKQSFLKDQFQYLPVRFSAQISLIKYLTEKGVMYIRGIYQNQGSVQYYQGGIFFDKLTGVDNETNIGAGAWYRSKDAISPYIRLGAKHFIIGATYDISINGLKSPTKSYRSMELSMQITLGENK